VVFKHGKLKYYNTKIIETSFTEVYEYEEVTGYGFTRPSNETNREYIKFEDASYEEKSKRVERMKKYHINERWELGRLIDANFDHRTSFLTLTFKENIDDIQKTNYEFNKFIKRLNYKIYKSKEAKLKYIGVWELQKRGAIHYHIVLFSVPKIPYKDLKEIWPYGSVNIKKIDVDQRENIGRYISKYFEKNIGDPQLLVKFMNKKRVFKSKNLKQPKIRFELNEEWKTFSDDEVLFQKTYTGYKKVGGGYQEYRIRYTKLKHRSDNK
jgi:hypothetical protein